MDITKRIAAVDPVHGATMEQRPTSFATEALPFWSKFKLLHATVELPQKPLALLYADDGARLVPLSGEASVYKVNALEGLNLKEPGALEYLRFFVANAEVGTRKIVEKAADVKWLASSESDPQRKQARDAAAAQIRPMTCRDAPEGYLVVAIVLDGQQLLEVTYDVSVRGTVKLKQSKELASRLPVPVVLE